MATILIWHRYDGENPKVIDRANSKPEAGYLVHEYRRMASREDKIWAGRKSDEPKERK